MSIFVNLSLPSALSNENVTDFEKKLDESFEHRMGNYDEIIN